MVRVHTYLVPDSFVILSNLVVRTPVSSSSSDCHNKWRRVRLRLIKQAGSWNRGHDWINPPFSCTDILTKLLPEIVHLNKMSAVATKKGLPRKRLSRGGKPKVKAVNVVSAVLCANPIDSVVTLLSIQSSSRLTLCIFRLSLLSIGDRKNDCWILLWPVACDPGT